MFLESNIIILTLKLNNLNFHSLEAVSCYRDLQLKCVNITQMCLIRDETFAKLDV